MGFVISSHNVICLSKGELNCCFRRVRVGKPERGSMEALTFHRNITKTLCPLDECDQLSSVFVVVVLVLVPSC